MTGGVDGDDPCPKAIQVLLTLHFALEKMPDLSTEI